MSTVEMTAENFDETISGNQIVFIDFWAQWCGPCKSFATIYQDVAAANPDVVFAKVDIESQPGLAQDFHIRSIPMLMVFKEKVVIFQEAGVLPKEGLENLVEQTRGLDMEEVHSAIAKHQEEE